MSFINFLSIFKIAQESVLKKTKLSSKISSRVEGTSARVGNRRYLYNSSKIIINNTSDTTHPVEIIRVLPILLMLLVDWTALPVLFLCSWVVVSGMNITYIYLLNNIKPIFTFFERLKNGVKYNVWLWKKEFI